MLQRWSIFKLIFFLYLPSLVLNWCKQTYFKTGKQIKAMAGSPCSRYIAVAHVDNYVRFYHGDNYNKVGEYNVGFVINAIRFSNDGNYLAVGGASSSVPILNAYEPFGLNTTVNANIGSNINGIDFSSDSAKFIACGGTGTGAGKINMFTVNHTAPWTTNITSPVNMNPATSAANDCRISPFDGKIGVDINTKISIYDPTLTTPVPWAAGSTTYTKMVFDPNGTNLMYIDTNGNQFYNLIIATGVATALSGPANILNALDFSFDGKYIATGGQEKILYIYDSTRASVERWDTADKIRGVVFNKQTINQRLYAGDFSGQVLVLSFNCSGQWCPSDHYSDPTGCKFCGDAIAKCIDCMNGTICDKCIDGYFVSPNDYQCKVCTMLGCLTCAAANNCTQCHSGFYSVAVSGLTTCKRCAQGTGMQGCAICNTSTICIACNNDYYLDNSNKCKLCSNISNCLKCNNATVCTECITGYYKNGNTCSACATNCLACEATSTNCTQCPKGWYVNSPTSYTCTRCQTGCLACNNSNFCFECQNNMYQMADGSCALCVFPCLNCEDSSICNLCSELYYLSGTTCLSCTNNCATCNTSAYCTTCLAGYYLETGNICKTCIQKYGFCQYCSPTACQSCQNGYFLNSSTLCQHCSEKMFKCEKCTSLTNCLSCVEGFYLTGSTGNASCQTCVTGCQTCVNSGDCRKCFKQYYLDANLDCIACSGNCLQCTDATTCTICDEGYYLDTGVCKLCKVNLTNCLQCSSGTVCINCEIGYYLDSSDTKCKKCAGNCVTCDQTKCLSCEIGYYLTATATPTCLACSQVCTECTTATVCTSCKSGFYLDAGTSTCKNCTPNRYCRTCNTANCSSCIYGYYLDSTISPPNFKCTSCLSKIQGCIHCNATNYCLACDYGYYLDAGTNVCASCTAINGCEKCSDSATCLLCGPGFFLNSSSKCQQCKQGCSTCDPSGTCYTCSPGFYLNGANCLACMTNIQGCLLCSSSATCVDCMNGYYLQAGTPQCNSCRSSLAGCLYCNSSSICTNCQPGFYLNTTSYKCETCEKNLAGCDICSSSSVCLDCQVSYYLTAGGGAGCTPCVSSLAGCMSCSDINTCEICKTGFYLHTDNKCRACNTLNNGCQACVTDGSGGIVCSQCSSGFIINLANNLCIPCGSLGCSICDHTNPNVCISCDSMYFKSGTSCTRCNSVMQGCDQCLTNTQCIACDIGYYLDATGKCKLCQDVLGGCSKCSFNGGVHECQDCKSSYILDTVTKTCSSCFSVLQGCTYCVNSTACISCQNGYFKDSATNLCRSCTEQQGCILCSDQTACEYCASSYYMDHSLSKCLKCSVAIEFCMTCLEPTRCLSCQSGYMVNDKFECEQVTVKATQKIEGVKLITEFIDKETLSHTLMVSNDQYSNPGYDLTGACSLYLTDYNQLTESKKIVQVQLQIKDVKWLSPTKIQFYTDNPTNMNTNTMSLVRRLYSQQTIVDIDQVPNLLPRLLTESRSNMGNFKVSLEMNQEAVNTILPNFYQTGDLILDYSLDEPQFYMSYLKSSSSGSAFYSLFGYIVTCVLLLNFIVKTYKLSNNQNKHHYTGQIMGHVFALKSIALFHYPITYEFYYFCYGFMLTDLPWLNYQIGSIFGERSDYVPKQLVMYFYNLNIASTYLLSLALSIILLSLRFVISKNKELVRSKYTQFIYCVFMFGLTFAGCLALQGAKFNPMKQVSISAVFYLIGIIIYLAVFIQMLYSVYSDKANFYRVRIFLKATLLSIAHLNPIIIVSMSIILDVLLVVLQFIIIQKQVAWGKIWLLNHLLLDMALALTFILPNSALSLYGAMALVGIVTLMQLLLNVKLMSYCEQKAKLQINKAQNAKDNVANKSGFIMNESLQTFIDDKQYGKFDLWNQQFTRDVGSLNDIAIQDQRVDKVKKQFLQATETKYTAIMRGFKEKPQEYEQNLKNQLSRKRKQQYNKRQQKGRKVSKKLSSKYSERQKLKFGNPFRIQSSSSSPTEQSVASNEEKQKKKTQTHFIQSKNRQRKRQNPLS